MNPMSPDMPLWLQPGGKQLEFKRDLSSPRNLLKTLVAFANSAGGKLVIGVNDARHIVGVADPLAKEERIRNPVIARVFRELHLSEQWGSGVRRIFAMAQAQGLPTPSLTEMATGVRLSVMLTQVHTLDGAQGAHGAQGRRLAHEATDNLSASEQVGEQVSEQVDAQVRQLLSLCAQEPRTKQELLAALHLSNAYLNYKRHIVPVLESGLIAMTLPDKPQSRLQRYRLTAQGRALLAALQTQENP